MQITRRHHTLFILFLTLTSLAFASCGNKTSSAGDDADSITADSVASDNPDVLTFDSIVWTDSAAYKEKNKARVERHVVYAKSGPQALRDSINTWIATLYGKEHYTPTPSALRSLILDDSKSTLKDYIDEIRGLVEDRESDEDVDTDSWSINYENVDEVMVIYEDEEYVTLFSQSYMYLAGAHGTTGTTGTTFRKSDGKRLGWELLSGVPRRDLIRQIKTGLMDYYEIHGETEEGMSKDDQLREILFDMEYDTYEKHFPLPASTPYLTADGVVLVYQQYEICAYAYGMPEVVIKRKK